jgi:hypothetical protein
MKLKMSFVGLLFVAANLAAVSTNAQTTNADFQQAVAAYQRSNSVANAEKVIKLAAALPQLPPIPEEARKHFVMGQTIFTGPGTQMISCKPPVNSEKPSNKLRGWRTRGIIWGWHGKPPAITAKQ